MLRYTCAQRLLHWLMAALILGLLLMGFFMEDVPKPLRADTYALHKSLGMTVLLLLVVRISARLKHAAPPYNPPLTRPVRMLAKATHIAFYVLMALMPLSGYLMAALKGRPVVWFGQTLPQLVPLNPALAKLCHESHETLAYGLLALIGLHIAGFAYHAFGSGHKGFGYRMAMGKTQ